jgi:hypothetical protein
MKWHALAREPNHCAPTYAGIRPFSSREQQCSGSRSIACRPWPPDQRGFIVGSLPIRAAPMPSQKHPFATNSVGLPIGVIEVAATNGGW